jgi:hypothetical protein
VTDLDTKQKVANYADIVVKIEGHFGLIIELKYVQAPFLEGYYGRPEKMPFPAPGDVPSMRYMKATSRRNALSAIGEELANKTPEELRALKFYEKFNETTNCISVATKEDTAIEQVKRYHCAMPNTQPAFKWYAATIVGVVSNLVCACVNFTLSDTGERLTNIIESDVTGTK